MINDRKTPVKLRIHSSNEVIDYKTQFWEWKIQVTISFVSSKDSDEVRTMHKEW